MDSNGDPRRTEDFESLEEWATRVYLRKGSEDWSAADQVEFDRRLEDPGHLKAYQGVVNAWQALGRHAAAPELADFRREALERSRRGNAANWLGRLSSPGVKWATTASLALVLGLTAGLFFLSRSEIVYETGIGEQRIVELADRSSIALDANTSVRIRYTRDSRVVDLSHGQAQFMVARDPKRPFRVDVGEHTITAVGTSFNVDYAGQGMQVAMVEGKVVVSIGNSSIESRDLVAGQALQVDADAQAHLFANADIGAAIAWRQGKIILNDTTLADAVRRFNRYSRMQIVVHGPEIEALRVSGVFQSGDTQAFVEAIQASLPILVVQEATGLVTLKSVMSDGDRVTDDADAR